MAGPPADAVALRTAVRRGMKVPGGACGYMGVCGAAAGVGTAFSVLLGATPRDAAARREAILATSAALARIGAHPAARCCQRDAWLALQEAVRLAPSLLGVAPRADAPLVCAQQARNRECSGTNCPLHPRASRS